MNRIRIVVAAVALLATAGTVAATASVPPGRRTGSDTPAYALVCPAGTHAETISGVSSTGRPWSTQTCVSDAP